MMPAGLRRPQFMASPGSPRRPSSISDLADRLDRFIEESGLQAGDAFLTARETATHLQVRRDDANRALQILVHRGVIERRQRLGARVLAPSRNVPELEKVLVVVQGDGARGEVGFAPGAQVGLHSKFAGASIELISVETGGAGYGVAPLIRSALKSGRRVGLVLVRCDYPTQRLAADSGIPVVIHGSAFQGIPISSVDLDYHRAGWLHGEAFKERGCDRWFSLGRDRILPGDRHFLNGFREAAAANGMACDAVADVGVGPYPDLTRAVIEDLLETPGRLGVVAQTHELAAEVARIAGALGSDTRVHTNAIANGSVSASYSFLTACQEVEEQGAILGSLLRERAVSPAAEPVHYLVDCQLVEQGVKL